MDQVETVQDINIRFSPYRRQSLGFLVAKMIVMGSRVYNDIKMGTLPSKVGILTTILS